MSDETFSKFSKSDFQGKDFNILNSFVFILIIDYEIADTC